MITIPEIPSPVTVTQRLVNETKDFLRSPKFPVIMSGVVLVGSVASAFGIDAEKYPEVRAAMFAIAVVAFLALLYSLWKLRCCDGREIQPVPVEEVELAPAQPVNAPA